MTARIKKTFGVFERGGMQPIEPFPTRAKAASAIHRIAKQNEKKSTVWKWCFGNLFRPTFLVPGGANVTSNLS